MKQASQLRQPANIVEPIEGCISYAVKVLGDKWSPLLLRELAKKPTVRFCELQEKAGGVNPRTLSERLAKFESEGIVDKTIFPEMPPRVEYSLTQKGAELIPILQQMAHWGQKHYSAKTSQ